MRKFPSPCGDYGSYQELLKQFKEHKKKFPSPCGDYGSYHTLTSHCLD